MGDSEPGPFEMAAGFGNWIEINPESVTPAATGEPWKSTLVVLLDEIPATEMPNDKIIGAPSPVTLITI